MFLIVSQIAARTESFCSKDFKFPGENPFILISEDSRKREQNAKIPFNPGD